MASTAKLRPAVRADVIKMNGQPFEHTFNGFTFDCGGEVLGIAGVMHSHPKQAFSMIKPEMVKHKRLIVKAIGEMRKILDKYHGEPVFAVADKRYSSAPGLLKHTGFIPTDREGVFVWVHKT